ncbi:MAG: GNAT family N-acetyltransferase [Reyranella sp.]|uniref:GNAT family N-acetyltransferase n=1 Tax=Reyranella sp. TaxID=1929291 RepID=UPI001AC8FFB0|nr:GNAT family N-acetyltransferase [Reyranella sp.]MBN9086240.1 GNAT family N-acetyltransferase [Reyranella sp.]
MTPMTPMLTVARSSVAAIAGATEFAALAAEYAAEAAIDGLPPPAAKMETYRQLEAAGMLQAFSASIDGTLIGFITLLAPVLPHYGVPVAVSESFFVAGAHRRSGAGLGLLGAAEAEARALGSPGLLVSAPFGGRLFEVLPRRGYVETNRVFFKKVGDG